MGTKGISGTRAALVLVAGGDVGSDGGEAVGLFLGCDAVAGRAVVFDDGAAVGNAGGMAVIRSGD